jgi:hypothetical protein
MAVKKTKRAAVKKSAKAVKKPAKKAAVKNNALDPSARASMDVPNLQAIIKSLDTLMEDFKGIVRLYANLTAKERERLIGAGIRNYGFIEKANDLGNDNPAFLPPQFNMAPFNQNLQVFDLVRQFYILAEKLQTLASDSMLLKSNDLYRDSLRIYNGLKEQARGRVPGARDLFDALEPFFKRRRVSESQPTQKQELHRIENIFKGKTEGEVLVRNIKPKKSGGVHEVIEATGKERITGKETIEANN